MAMMAVLGLALGHESTEPSAFGIPKYRFDLYAQSDKECEYNFRFKRDEIKLIVRQLGIPNPLPNKYRYYATAEEALCKLLNRVARRFALLQMKP
ncbi:hypothetical protein H310_13842 [Aphanomyces invadans]|uniref:Uncharacterized protein n=1 Tax=Aphanomyces invadans TaxID=157072 RepID=A0A024TDX3_9STRA|nr:hypothetical protein H310_13842 [Aphanomyces invadans]ETV91786.1 hypothetical protein H310_13842 [Aphanomyces invadans]|eukprot:XP_008879712.1 hypothetical protein H310_13842 [Aphanomyces invadans]